MRDQFGNWQGYRRERPWLAVLRYTIKKARQKDWLIATAIGIMWALICVLRGSRNPQGEPEWETAFFVGGAAAVAFLFANVAGRRQQRIFGTVLPIKTEPWISVVHSVDNEPQGNQTELGSATIDKGMLIYSGERSSFQFPLNELRILKWDRSRSTIDLEFTATGQTLSLANNYPEKHASWALFIEEIKHGSTPGSRPAALPPKRIHSTSLAAVWGVTILFSASALESLSWQMAAPLPMERDLGFALTYLLWVFILVSLMLFANLWYWRHMREYERKKAIARHGAIPPTAS
ncbi:MAG: hypothetical protein H7Y17_16555 [Chlorobia bacterium]|nr:hypothetical protein [Fimbriimonadaceae bacterium]